MRVAMIGTGYVGLVSGACFADGRLTAAPGQNPATDFPTRIADRFSRLTEDFARGPIDSTESIGRGAAPRRGGFGVRLPPPNTVGANGSPGDPLAWNRMSSPNTRDKPREPRVAASNPQAPCDS